MNASAKYASIHRGLSTVCDALLLCIIMLVPLLMGGRHPLGKLVYVALVATLSVTWLTQQCLAGQGTWRRSGVEYLVPLAALLVALQIVSLPESWIARLSPWIGENLTLWASSATSGASLGPWASLSLTPESTRLGLAILLAHGMLFGVLLQRLNRLGDIERLLKWIAVATIGMATLGLAQYLFGNGKFLWVYEHPSRTTYSAVKGTFANQNHFAQYLALGLGPLIWWLTRAWEKVPCRSTRPSFATAATSDWSQLVAIGLAFSFGLVTLAGLLSLSRGGLTVMFVAMLTCVAVCLWRSRLGKGPLAVLATAGCVVILAICIHGSQLLSAEIQTVTDGSIETLDHNEARRRIWAANMAAIRHFPVTGTGVGSHREVYPTYFVHPSSFEYTHAENSYLQVLLESGPLGLSLLLAGIALCGTWSVRGLHACRSPRVAACLAAVVAGLTASVTHSLVDFVWYLPACMSVAVMFAACACRLFQIVREDAGTRGFEVALTRGVWGGAWVITILLAIAMVHNWFGPGLAALHWDRYLVESLASKRHPVLMGEPLDDGQDTQLVQSTQVMRQHLQRALRWNPDDARANLRMAGACLRMFEYTQRHSDNAMGLSQIRDAALASRFDSCEALNEWLAVAIGDNRLYLDQALVSAHRAVRRCPLQGEGYAYLAELAFLEGKGQDVQRAYVGQALKVRPYDGPILFTAGREAMLTGQITLALHLWQRAFSQDRQLQKQIVTVLARQVPAAALIAQLQPDIDAMGVIFHHYRAIQQDDQANVVGQSYVTMLEDAAGKEYGAASAGRWRQASNVHRFLGNTERAIRCLSQSAAEAPNDFSLRRTLASMLYAEQQYDQAYEHFLWCARRKPHDGRIQRRLRDSRARMELPSAPAVSRSPDPTPMRR